MLQPGDHVGRYEVQAIIGEGGFGKVYQAWDAGLERPVAIKVLSRERQAREPEQYAAYRERFRIERRVQGGFQHPHIVSVYDLVQQDGDEYLVEEFVAGGTLRALIQREGQLSPRCVVQIGVEMCQAIAAGWEQDVVHRDIKPSNILLTDDGQAKLTDFGVAQVGQMSQRTQSDSHHPGTPAYMSPEQEKGYGYLDERSDLYALGLVLYEALTGKSFKRERVSVRELRPDVPKTLDKVVMRALAPDPVDRYQRAVEFEVALRQAVKGSRPRWWWWGGGGTLLVVVLVVAGWFSTRASQGQGGVTPTVTATSLSSQTPISVTPSAKPTTAKTHTPVSSVTPSPTVAPTLRLTYTPRVAVPRLISPLGAAEIKTSQPTLRWEGQLPNTDYGFRVSLRHGSGTPRFISPVLEDPQWLADLPGDVVGEWRWSVAVVRRDETTEVLARSDEWTFYYNPFGEQPLPTSPLPVPFDSPLSLPQDSPSVIPGHR